MYVYINAHMHYLASQADDITLGPRLGHGAFGVVYMGTLGANTKV